MNEFLRSILLQSTGATSFKEKEVIKELWSGYGKIVRVELDNASVESVVIKQVQLPKDKSYSHRWDIDIGHQRKVKSYMVEATWYNRYSTNSAARLPKCLAIETQGDEVMIVLEDMDLSGYPIRKTIATWEEISFCLSWLAQFHASYLGQITAGLWDTGTYWHLETRPQELAAIDNLRLREAAITIDNKLNDCKFKTFVHGDAKLANFCFAKDGHVA